MQVEGLTGHGRRLGRSARLLGQLEGAHEHRVPDGLGHRHLAGAAELEAARAGLQAAGREQSAGELLHEEGDPLRAVVERMDQRGRRRARKQLPEQPGSLVAVEWREGQLVQAAAPAELVAQPAQHVIARQSVGAVRGDQEDGQLLQRPPECREQLEGGFVRPVQIVEDDEHVSLPGDVRKGCPHGLEERRAVARGRRCAQLGKEHRQVRSQDVATIQTRGVHAQVRAQRGHHGAIRSGGAVARRPAQHESRGGLGHLRGEAGLPDPGLAAEQHDRARSPPRAIDGLRQPHAFGLTTDERAPHVHAGSLGSSIQPATGAGSGRTMTVSAIGTISSTGSTASRACSWMASGLTAS